MKASDEERREIAARLRENVGLSSRLPNEYSIEVKSALVLSKLLDCIDCSDDVFLHLADLIDRPTCRNIYDESKAGACENGFECSECGNVVEDGDGWLVNGTFNEGITWCDVDEVRKALDIYYDYDPCIYEAEKVKRLADLIDRPTTKREGGCGIYWRCPLCGAFNRKDAVTDCCGVIPSRFCPNCGAEVVE